MRVLIIGGTGTVGSAVAAELAGRHEIITATRNSDHLRVDITDPDSIRGLFDVVGEVDAVVVAAGEGPFKPMDQLSDDDYAFGLDSKLMGQVDVVRHGHRRVRDGGSFTLTSGITGRMPLPGCTSFSMVNAAVEGFARAAALELPRGIRINTVCPQWASVTLQQYGMDPAWGVPTDRIAQGYVESIEGTRTGKVIDTGWRYDWENESLTIAAP